MNAFKDRESRIDQKFDIEELLKEFDTSKCHIAEDWRRWLFKSSHSLLK
jgi:hypothetical protein